MLGMYSCCSSHGTAGYAWLGLNWKLSWNNTTTTSELAVAVGCWEGMGTQGVRRTLTPLACVDGCMHSVWWRLLQLCCGHVQHVVGLDTSVCSCSFGSAVVRDNQHELQSHSVGWDGAADERLHVPVDAAVDVIADI